MIKKEKRKSSTAVQKEIHQKDTAAKGPVEIKKFKAAEKKERKEIFDY